MGAASIHQRLAGHLGEPGGPITTRSAGQARPMPRPCLVMIPASSVQSYDSIHCLKFDRDSRLEISLLISTAGRSSSSKVAIIATFLEKASPLRAFLSVFRPSKRPQWSASIECSRPPRTWALAWAVLRQQ